MDIENHRIVNFRYCLRCGAEGIGIEGTNVVKCSGCGFVFYLNTAAAVAALITDDEGKLLITVRAKEPARGRWDLPGGFVDPGESAEDALRREVKEELNLDIISMTYLSSAPNLYEYKQVTYSVVDFAYLCQVKDIDQARPQDDVASLLLKSPAEIDPEKFAFPSTRKIVSGYIDSLAR